MSQPEAQELRRWIEQAEKALQESRQGYDTLAQTRLEMLMLDMKRQLAHRKSKEDQP